ncbi:MAG: glycoside hydrolase family 5 protein [Planctomycetaceae bacterium]|jgi:aryl-phospho-beta-D-glucosidase BglC (GH1 family)|nr:glycoside hydrolase family 5 protein [Planctomycetaceae bacterium]
MQRRDVLKLGLASGLANFSFFSSGIQAEEGKLLKGARHDKLPQWRGFNLSEKGNKRWNGRFVEDDFRWIRDFGFNFVRLPMDYRLWIKDNDWRKINEQVLDEIDEAVQFGERYGIHVNINFHRAPGYTVARPAEPKSVWTDSEALDVCLLHWKTFAKRYKGLSNDLVSFNLFNEPDKIEPILAQCVAVHKAIIKGIREEDPNRLIICDGYEWGAKPFFDLADQNIAQATRGYAPTEISHYKASWVDSKNYLVPTWPINSGNGLLMSNSKREIKEELRGALIISGQFPNTAKLRLRVGTVSDTTTFVVIADGKTIFEHQFKPADGEGEWKTVVFKKEWNIYQNVYDRDYETVIPAGTQQLEIRVTRGDWLTLTQLAVWSEKAKQETSINLAPNWQQPPSKFLYRESDHKAELLGEVKDKTWLRNRLEPWKKLQQQGCGVMVGEFGAYSPCPHDVTLRWMADCLANWREAGWGYALWEFRGSFGILDSGRTDVDYEDFHGHKLDRKMLKLLQENS